MVRQNRKFRSYLVLWHGLRPDKRFCRVGLTLAEMIIALIIMTIIFAAVLPQFRAISNGWDSKRANAELIQNGRVLMDHITRNLSKAVQITAVSLSSDTDGYISFADYNGDVNRYDINSIDNYVEFGAPGSPSCLAGPVSLLQFTCYDACDLDTPITDVNLIRVVKVDATVITPDSSGRSKTFTTWVYLRTNANAECGIVGCWKLDETSGTTAADSSGKGHDGTLVNMTSPGCWVAGQIGGALNFDGVNDYVGCGSGPSNYDNITVSAWMKTSTEGILVSNRDNGGSYGTWYTLSSRDIELGDNSQGGYRHLNFNTTTLNNIWHHIAYTKDGINNAVYVDGVLDRSFTSNADISNNTIPTLIGKRWTRSNATAWFNGPIDEVRIYNRALSAGEVAVLANALRYRSFIGQGLIYQGSLPKYVTISTPTVNTGDLLIAAVATDGDCSATISPPAGRGWTSIGSPGAYSGAVTLAAWYKIAGTPTAPEPTSHTFTWTTTGDRQAYGWMMRFTGQNPTNPINAYSTYGESNINPLSPSVTTTVNNCLILRLGAFDEDNVTTAPAPGNPGLSGHSVITMGESSDTSKVITYGGFSEAKLPTDGSSITVAKPAGTVQNNLLIAAVATDGATYNTLAPVESGWSQITTLPGGSPLSSVTLRAWYKTAGASEPANYTFNWTGSEQAYAWIMRLILSSGTFNYGAWPSPVYTDAPNISPFCGISYIGPSGMGNVITIRLGAFDDDAISIDNPGLSAGHNVITMDSSSAGAGSVSGGAGYILHNGDSLTSNFSLTAAKAYWTTSPSMYPQGVFAYSCSGGAGYIRQPNAGPSGTSTFLLGSANEARMLTIAIAPANGDDYCCGDQLQP